MAKALNVTMIQPTIHIHPSEVVKDISARDLDGLNVVFINMPLRETARPNNTPEGPLLMATNLRRNYGVWATIIDLNAYRIKDELSDKLSLPLGRHLTQKEVRELVARHFEVNGRPAVVALSGIITTLRWQETVAKIVRELVPDAFLVSGNGLATELKAGLFTYIPELDAVAHSEGDDVILKVCLDARTIGQMGIREAAHSGKLAPYYLGDHGGRHRFIYAGDRPRNLDLIPFGDLGLLETDVYGNPLLEWYLKAPIWGISANNSSATPFTMERSANSVSSRGCPFACNYCYRGQQGERNWGVRSADHIYAEITAHMEKYGIDFKGFVDDNFAVAIPRIEAMVPLLGSLSVRWGTHTRMDEGADPKRIRPMAKAGCVYIGFGPESADAEVLKAINKGGQTLSNGFEEVVIDGRTYNFPRSMTMATRNCLEFGIHANCTWIMGLPTETGERLKNTVPFIRWQEELYAKHGIPPEAVNKQLFTLTWYPGTEMIKYEKVRRELTRVFGITFQKSDSPTGPYESVCDENFYRYLLELDDATKVLHGQDGEPLNFSDMSTEIFLQARECVDSDQLFRILDM